MDYVISTQDVHSEFDCAIACVSEVQCRSYNFEISGHPTHWCELNNQSESSSKSGDLIVESGYDYCELDEREVRKSGQISR